MAIWIAKVLGLNLGDNRSYTIAAVDRKQAEQQAIRLAHKDGLKCVLVTSLEEQVLAPQQNGELS
jgi:hypothetical protein